MKEPKQIKKIHLIDGGCQVWCHCKDKIIKHDFKVLKVIGVFCNKCKSLYIHNGGLYNETHK